MKKNKYDKLQNKVNRMTETVTNESMINGCIKWEAEVKKSQIDFDFFHEINGGT